MWNQTDDINLANLPNIPNKPDQIGVTTEDQVKYDNDLIATESKSDEYRICHRITNPWKKIHSQKWMVYKI